MTCTAINATFMIGSVLIFHDAFIMLVSMLIGRIGVMLITVKMTSDTLPYLPAQQFRDLILNLPATFVAAAVTIAAGALTSNMWLQSLIQGITMVLVYLLVTLIANKSTLTKVLSIVLSLVKKK